jgi:serine/threonine protein kinase
VPISPMESAGSTPKKPRAALGGRFWLEEKLGEDASGELHRAIDLRSGTATMVRIVRGEGAARRERLLRETKRAAQVKHPGLAVVLGVGETEEGDVFVAAETIVGDRLSDRLRVGERFDEWEAAEIATQIAHALSAAHDADVVHRELRPSLIVLTYEGDNTIVKVEGLGLPRPPSSDADPELDYSAPEQRSGKPVGRRADVYSIGGMLYAMLTGLPPTADAPPVAGLLGDVVKRCLAEDPKDRFNDTIALSAAMKITAESLPPRMPSRMPMAGSVPPPVELIAAALAPTPTPTVVDEDDEDDEQAPDSAPSPYLAPSLAPPSVKPASTTASTPPSDPPPPVSVRASQRPPSVRPAPTSDAPPSGRPPSAPPQRLLGRPLSAQPRWRELLLDLGGGPLPRVAIVVVVMFIVARILTSTAAAVVASLAAGLAFYATWRKTRGQPPDT